MRTEPGIGRLIDQHISGLGGWRSETLAELRNLIRAALPEVEEEWKWGGPVWSLDGIICTGESYKQTVKLTFAKGAALKDPAGLFNASLSGNTRRAIDFKEGDRVNARAFKALVKEAAAQNGAAGKDVKPVKPSKPSSSAKSPKSNDAAKPKPVKLLSGDNPQIPKGDGDAPVQAYIAAIPGWKGDAAAKLDAVIVRSVPGVLKAVKWNSAFYGVDPGQWFLCFHVFAKYLKVTFFRGTSLKPLPPESSKTPETRYVHVTEDGFDEAQMTRWIKQAAALPGEKL